MLAVLRRGNLMEFPIVVGIDCVSDGTAQYHQNVFRHGVIGMRARFIDGRSQDPKRVAGVDSHGLENRFFIVISPRQEDHNNLFFFSRGIQNDLDSVVALPIPVKISRGQRGRMSRLMLFVGLLDERSDWGYFPTRIFLVQSVEDDIG